MAKVNRPTVELVRVSGISCWTAIVDETKSVDMAKVTNLAG